MIRDTLQRKLSPLKDAEDLVFRRWVISGVLLLGAGILVVMIWLAMERDWFSGGLIFGLLLISSLLVMVTVTLKKQQSLNLKKLAGRIEGHHPELQQALLTAVEQKPGPDGKMSYLQERVIEEAVDHAMEHDWIQSVYRPQLLVAAWVQGFALFNVLVMLVGLLIIAGRIPAALEDNPEELVALADYEISVSPGDTEVERGHRLIVEAQFGKRIPSAAEIIVTDAAEGGQEMGRVAMKQGLDDGNYSGLINRIDRDAHYRVVFEGGQSEDFDITTYVHPKLEQVDVEITPPAYTNLEKKEVKDVRKVSALEGSELAFRMRVNKEVEAAELFGEDESVIPLVPSKDDATILEAAFVPDDSKKYRVHLVDAEERSNKEPPWLKVTVKKNTPPKLDLVFPKRDVAVSAVQELPVEAQVWDDLGVTGTGAVFVIGDKEKEISFGATALAGGETHPLKTLLAIEELGLKPKDLISYYLWAEDQDARGEVRRVMSDMFFAEVRHFEDIFREMQAMGGQGQPQQQGESDKLVELQKEVINATWKLIRRSGGGEPFEKVGKDVDVVKQSQEIVGQKVEAALEKIKDEQIRTYLESAGAKMKQAVMELGGVLESQEGRELSKPMKSSRGAYEDLLLAQGREHQVTRGKNSQSQGGGKQKMQSQLMQLELKQEENRYEKASEAKDQPEQSAEQKENLAVLNRLKELARRQEALAKKIKELENLLSKANTAEEKEELQKQLKRLQEEQEQLLRELDDVTERMDQPENRANMAEQRKQLEETREEVRKASEDLKQENLADAANSATRAQRELDEVKEDFRKKTSRRFSDEMRAVRNQARDLAEKQQEIGEKLEQAGNSSAKTNDPFGNQEDMLKNLELGREIDEQRKELEKMLGEMRRISEEAEGSEELLSNALYEAVRTAKTQGVDEALEEARDLSRVARNDLAQEAEGRAAKGIEQLKKDVEKAADKVLGNEGDALRMARAELDDLLRQVEEEKQGMQQGGEPGNGKREQREGQMEVAMNDAGKRRSPGKEGEQAEAGQPSNQGEKGNQGEKSKEGGQSKEGEQPAGKEPGEPGEQKGAGAKEDPEGKPAGGKEGQQGKPGEGKGDPSEKEQSPGSGQGQGEKESNKPGSGKPGESQPGEGKSGDQPGRQLAEKEGQAGQQPGKGQPGNQQNGQSQPGEGQDAQGRPGEKGEGKMAQQGKPGQAQEPGQSQQDGGKQQQGVAQSGSRSGATRPNGGATNHGGDDRRHGILPEGGQTGSPMFFDRPVEEEPAGPLTGKDYEEWADRLRDVEETLDDPKLRNEVAKVLDNARAMRIDHRRNNMPPQADVIDKKIITPLVELRDQVAEQLLRMDKKNPLAPIDRDPVPPEYRVLVKKYYQELGGGR